MAGVIQDLENTETITISLEDAAQIILQEQGIPMDGSGTVHIPPGTYHILTQEGAQISADGMLLSEGGAMDAVGITVIQSADEQIGYGVESGELLNGSETIQVQAITDGSGLGHQDGTIQLITQPMSQHDGDSQMFTIMKSESPSMVTQMVHVLQPSDQQGSESIHCVIDPSQQLTLQSQDDLDAGITAQNEDITIDPLRIMPDLPQDEDAVEEPGVTEGSEGTEETEVMERSEVAQPVDTTPDTTFTDSSDVSSVAQLTTDGVPPGEAVDLLADASVTEAPPSEAQPTEVPPSSAEILPIKIKKEEDKQLDLSKPIAVTNKTEVVINGKKCILMANPTTGELCAYPVLPPPGKRKRGRPRKELDTTATHPGSKMAIVTSPHQDKDQNSAAEGLLELGNTDPDGIRRSGRVRKQAKTLNDYEVLELSSDSGGEDDEDGSKRRRIDDKNYVPLTPYLLPNPGVKRGRGRPRRYPPPTNSTQIPAVVIPGANGQTIMMAPIQGLSNLHAFQEQVKALPSVLRHPDDSDEDTSHIVTLNESDLSLDTEDSTLAEAAASATAGLTISLAQVDGKIGDNEDADQQTIIQIPESLLSMFIPKKDPVKIGLKASESDLEKMKCSKCNFQAFYLQQYQTHIASHTDDVHKCKCCNYVTFIMDDLLAHFKENHPRCICTECEFMAEHAYIIKRHMMRHSANGCTCDLCGRVYKDHYILKMHIKMVHMPAEILFECTVCSKKFTRKAHLKRHLRIHEPEKPFKCPHCDYRGCERSDISKHLLIHEEPKHVCEVCNKAFRHLKNKELHLKRHNGQRDYKCGVCDFYGYTFTDIRKHIERKHADIKTLVCDKCGSAFKSESFLREHQKQQCEVFMIEQALAIANSTGDSSQATIQIPSSSFTVDGQQVLIDGHQIVTDGSGHVNITVERINMPDEEEEDEEEEEEDESITLTEVTEEQLQHTLEGAHISVSQTHVIHDELGANYIEEVEEITGEGVEEIPVEEIAGEGVEEMALTELRVGAITVDGSRVIEAHEVEGLVNEELEAAALDIAQEEEEEGVELSIVMAE